MAEDRANSLAADLDKEEAKDDHSKESLTRDSSPKDDALESSAAAADEEKAAPPAAPSGGPGPPPNGGAIAWLQVAGSWMLFFNTWGLLK